MGLAKKPLPVKLIVAVFSGQSALFAEIEHELEKKFGKIDFKSAPFDFNHTDYYREEMGGNLKKMFLSFENLISPEKLSAIKLFTNELERKRSDNAKRIVNIDPGYLDNSKLVLASTKNYYHRIYLGKGIYAEVTLFFKGNTFQSLPWTYPDYKTENSVNIFNKIRGIYREQLAGINI